MTNDELVMFQIVDSVRSLLREPARTIGHAPSLAALLTATQARAVGCWQHRQGVLHLAGFLAVDDMPPKVQAAFVAATRYVPLTHTEFGIVQAVVRGGLSVNHRAVDSEVPAAGSIGWLGRFEAASSLASPVVCGTELRGAIAVATSLHIEREDAVWNLVAELADRLSRSR